jgi:iron-sulfur cluster insertion protein
MIEVTQKAASELKILLEQEDKPGLALRIFVAGVACSGIQYGLAFDDEVKDDDVTMESNGIKLVMNKDIENTFSEGSIDFIEDENGKGFLIRNPSAGAGCGTCGGCH